MKHLYSICQTEKVWRDFPDGTHNDTVAEPGYFNYIEEFIRQYIV